MDAYSQSRRRVEDAWLAILSESGKRWIGWGLVFPDWAILMVRLLAGSRLSLEQKQKIQRGWASALQTRDRRQAFQRLIFAFEQGLNGVDPCAVADSWPGDPDVLAELQSLAKRLAQIAEKGWRQELEERLLRPGAWLRHLPAHPLVDALYRLRGITPPPPEIPPSSGIQRR